MTTQTSSAARSARSGHDAPRVGGRQRGLLGTTALSTGLSLLGATMLTLAPGQAHAQSCTTDAFPAYQCSSASDTPEIINADNAAVTTTPGFSVDTVGSDALSIAGRGALSYTDTNASSLTSIDDGLSVLAAGDVGGVPGSVTISTNGDVHGNADGINISNQTSGATNLIATGNVTASALFGVYVLNEASTTDLNIEAGTVQGGDASIFAYNRGTGATNVVATGDVSSTFGAGIRAGNDAAAIGGLTVQAASVRGASYGIDAENGGGGKTSVIATDDVFGSAQYGILATNGAVTFNPDFSVASVAPSAATDLMVEATSVTGGIDGIYANNQGTGMTSVTATGAVSGSIGMGIDAINGATANGIAVRAASASGGKIGIFAENEGGGTTSVTATGDVTGTQDYGILAANGVVAFDPQHPGIVSSIAPSDATDLTVEAASVTGGFEGIFAVNSGTGDTNVTATGIVSASNYAGISVQNNSTAGDLNVEAASANGGRFGIFAQNRGTGETDIIATSDVTGTSAYGILATNGLVTFNPDGAVANVEPSGATDLTVDASSVTGGLGGIYADNEGTGETSVTATGDVSSTGFAGIEAVNGATAGDLSVQAASVSGRAYGIYADNRGTGKTGVTATGDVKGFLAVFNGATANGLSVDVVSVEGGIIASNAGKGQTSVTATGDVATQQNFGILVTNGALTYEPDGRSVASVGPSAATDLTVEATNVSGGIGGIYANNQGTGMTSVAATGDVAGTAGLGIEAINGATATSLSVQAASVTGATDGIFAQNDGTQATEVTAADLVTGTSDTGIYATNGAAATDLSVEAAAVSGGRVGIYADNEGTGDTSVTATGDAAGGSIGGIYALNGDTAGDLSVEAASASGASFGIGAQNNGTGDTSVTATGKVASSDGEGLYVINGVGAGGLNVKAASVSGVSFGIDAENSGKGMTSVTATGDVSATQGYGILATNGAVTLDPDGYDIDDIGPSAATGLTVDAAKVTGGLAGIYADNEATGKTSVTATGDVGSVAGEGIYAINGTGAGDLSVDAASVSGGLAGIVVENKGTGETSVTATGAITSAGIAGIYAQNNTSAGDLSVQVVSVSGGSDYGIEAENSGKGMTSITATGDVLGRGYGILATNGAVTLDAGGYVDDVGPSAATGLTVNATSVTGGLVGIYTENGGGGTTSITATGAVTSTGLAGIFAQNDDSAGDLSVEAAAVGGGEFGIVALNNGTGATSVTAHGLVEGQEAGIAATSNGQPIDILIDGPDALVRNSSGNTSDQAVVADSGPVTLTNNARLTGTVQFGDSGDRIFNHGTWTVAGGTSDFGGGADTLVNEADGVIVAGLSAAQAETTTFANLENTANRGTIALQDGGAGDVAHFSGDFLAGAGAVQTIDIDKAGRSDLVLIDGTATITGTTLDVANVGGFSFGTRYTVLSATGGLTGTFDAVNVSTPPAAFLGLIDSYDANNAYLQYTQIRAFADAGLTRNQIATGTGLDSLDQSGALFLAVVALPDDAAARAAFDQVSGEIHPSVRTALIEESRLPREAVLDRLREAPEGAGAWLQAVGDWGSNDSDSNAARLDRNTKGVLAGIDTMVDDTLRVGISGGYTDSSLDVDARHSHADMTSYHALGYLGGDFGALRLRASAGYSHSDIDTHRTIAFAGYTDALTARYNGSVLQGFGEFGYSMPVRGGAIEPFAGASVVRAHTGGVSENGGAAALSVDGDSQTSTTSTLGLHASTSTAGPISATATLGWQHRFGDLTPYSLMQFQGSDSFTIAGTPLSKDAAVAELAVGWRIAPNMTLGARYSGVIGGHSVDDSAKATLSFAF